MIIDQEADYIPKRPIRWSVVLIIIGTVLSIVATVALMEGQVADVLRVRSERPSRIEADVYQQTAPAERLRAEADRHLNGYGWVDRANGTIHVPLDVAIEQYLGGTP